MKKVRAKLGLSDVPLTSGDPIGPHRTPLPSDDTPLMALLTVDALSPVWA